eukprot:Polyplicarium_translucidae@DN2022_c0_g1_i5.p1
MWRSCVRLLALAGVAHAATCDFAADVVVLLDFTFSYIADMPVIQSQLPQFFDELKGERPGSRMGIVSYTDIPVPNFGLPIDSCAKVELPLTVDSTEVANVFQSFTMGNGWDLPEAQLMAIQHAALAPSMGWLPNGSVTPDDRPIHNIIILVTDAPYHTAGNEESHGLMANNGDGVIDCGTEDYPTLAQVTDALDARGALVGGLITGVETQLAYSEMISLTIGQQRGVVVELSDDSTDFLQSLTTAMESLSNVICSTQAPPATEPIGDCNLDNAIEMVYIQDLSMSAETYLSGMKIALPTSMVQIQNSYPEFKIALASHTDKPIYPLGYPVSLDYCYWLHHGLDSDISVFADHLEASFYRSGADQKESQMDAIFHVATDPAVGFTTALTDEQGRIINRVIVVSTDAEPHLAGDGLAYGLAPHSGKGGGDCRTEDYPSLLQVATALAMIGQGQTRVAFAVPHDMAGAYSAIALQWRAFGIFVDVFPNDDPVLAAAEAIANAGDPCGNVRLLQDVDAKLARHLTARVDPPVFVQAPVELTLEQIMRGVSPRRRI